MADEVIITRADFDVSATVAKLNQVREGVKGTRQNLRKLRRDIDAQQARVRQLRAQARRQQFVTGGTRGPSAFSGFGLSSIKQMSSGVKSAAFSLSAATLMTRLTEGASPVTQFGTTVLTGASGGLGGIMVSTVTALITQAQNISRKIEEVHRRIENEIKLRREEAKQRKKERQEDQRKTADLFQQLERKLTDQADDRNQRTLRLMARRAEGA